MKDSDIDNLLSTKAEKDGIKAYFNGLSIKDNPYDDSSFHQMNELSEWNFFNYGFLDAKNGIYNN